MLDAITANAYRLEFQEALQEFADRGKNLEGRTSAEQLSIQDLRYFLRRYENASDIALESTVAKYPETTFVISGADVRDDVNSQDLYQIKNSLDKNRRLTDFLEATFREHLKNAYGVNIYGDCRSTACRRTTLISHIADMLDNTDGRQVANNLNTLKATRFVNTLIDQLNLLAPGLSQSIATPSTRDAA